MSILLFTILVTVSKIQNPDVETKRLAADYGPKSLKTLH